MWILEKASEFVTAGVVGFIQTFLESVLTDIGDLLARIMGAAIDVLQYPIVINGIRYTQYLAGALITPILIYRILDIYILESKGEPSDTPYNLLVRLVKAVIFIVIVPIIIPKLYAFGSAVAYDINLIPGIEQPDLKDFMLTGEIINQSLAVLVVAFISIIVACFLWIQTYMRAFHLALLAVLAPIMGGLGLLEINEGMFPTWWKELLSICFAQATQLFLLKCSFYGLVNASIGDTLAHLIFFLAGLLFTIKAPKLLSAYLHSTGLGSAALGTARSAGTVVLARKLITKG